MYFQNKCVFNESRKRCYNKGWQGKVMGEMFINNYVGIFNCLFAYIVYLIYVYITLRTVDINITGVHIELILK